MIIDAKPGSGKTTTGIAATGGQGIVAYGWLNAVTEYVDHSAGRANTTVDNRLNSAWFGKGAELKTAAYEKALNYAPSLDAGSPTAPQDGHSIGFIIANKVALLWLIAFYLPIGLIWATVKWWLYCHAAAVHYAVEQPGRKWLRSLTWSSIKFNLRGIG